MKIELSKGGLLFHHHGRSPALIHLFKFSLLLANFFLMSQLHLVVPFKFFLCVASLQIQLDFNVSDVSFHNLIFRISLSACLIRFHSRYVLPSLLGFHLFIFSLLCRHLRHLTFDNHGFSQGHLEC